MKRVIILFLLLFSLSGLLSAQQDSTVRVSDFIKEIEQLDDHNHRMSLIIWMPWLYRQTAMIQASNGRPLDQRVQDMVKSMKQYTIVGVVDGKMVPFGINYRPDQDIRDSIRLTINDSVVFHPLEEKNLNSTMRDLLGLLRPIMSSMLGQMGNYLSFFVFENTNPKGKYYIDAGSPGKFSISLSQSTVFSWRLPLDVLTPPSYFPVDGEKLSGKFEYCPYHGRKLKSTH
jgi:hypothetical protein